MENGIRGGNFWGTLSLSGGEDADKDVDKQIPEVLYLTQEESFLGRINCSTSGKTQLVIPKPYISATHFAIKREPVDISEFRIILRDFGTNGTSVNGKVVGKDNECVLENEDKITFRLKGKDKLHYQFRILQRHASNEDKMKSVHKSPNERNKTSPERKLLSSSSTGPGPLDSTSDFMAKQIAALQNERQAQEERMASCLARLETSRQENVQLARERNHLQGTMETLRRELVEAQSSSLALEATATAAGARVIQLEAEITDQKEELEDRNRQLLQLGEELGHKTQVLESRVAMLDAANAAVASERSQRLLVERAVLVLQGELQEERDRADALQTEKEELVELLRVSEESSCRYKDALLQLADHMRARADSAQRRRRRLGQWHETMEGLLSELVGTLGSFGAIEEGVEDLEGVVAILGGAGIHWEVPHDEVYLVEWTEREEGAMAEAAAGGRTRTRMTSGQWVTPPRHRHRQTEPPLQGPVLGGKEGDIMSSPLPTQTTPTAGTARQRTENPLPPSPNPAQRHGAKGSPLGGAEAASDRDAGPMLTQTNSPVEPSVVTLRAKKRGRSLLEECSGLRGEEHSAPPPLLSGGLFGSQLQGNRGGSQGGSQVPLWVDDRASGAFVPTLARIPSDTALSEDRQRCSQSFPSQLDNSKIAAKQVPVYTVAGDSFRGVENMDAETLQTCPPVAAREPQLAESSQPQSQPFNLLSDQLRQVDSVSGSQRHLAGSQRLSQSQSQAQSHLESQSQMSSRSHKRTGPRGTRDSQGDQVDSQSGFGDGDNGGVTSSDDAPELMIGLDTYTTVFNDNTMRMDSLATGYGLGSQAKGRTADSSFMAGNEEEQGQHETAPVLDSSYGNSSPSR